MPAAGTQDEITALQLTCPLLGCIHQSSCQLSQRISLLDSSPSPFTAQYEVSLMMDSSTWKPLVS